MDQEEKFLRAISYAIAQGAWVEVSRLDIKTIPAIKFLITAIRGPYLPGEFLLIRR